MAINHGGNLLQVAEQYRSDPSEWVDLSTGVSPFVYPVTSVSMSAWNQLPQCDDGLEVAAKDYYQAPSLPVVVAGSQAAIMALPHLLTHKLGRCGAIALPRVGYKEHEYAWRSFDKDGGSWTLHFYDGKPTSNQIATCDVIVVINPNNPTGKMYHRDELLELHALVAESQGTLIVDEAFVDMTPKCSLLAPDTHFNHLIVLRSVGKFFGLAGARVGFVFGSDTALAWLKETLGPWTVTGPSREVVKQALGDTLWQRETRERIAQAAERLNRLLSTYLELKMSGTALFTTVYTDEAIELHHQLCQSQVFTRLCDEKDALRFGLPSDEHQWQQLQRALARLDLNRGLYESA